MEDALIIRESDFIKKEDALDYIAEELKFPSYFGRNLDALFDCLSDAGASVNIAFDPVPAEAAAEWYQSICDVFLDAASENENIRVFFRAGKAEASPED